LDTLSAAKLDRLPRGEQDEVVGAATYHECHRKVNDDHPQGSLSQTPPTSILHNNSIVGESSRWATVPAHCGEIAFGCFPSPGTPGEGRVRVLSQLRRPFPSPNPEYREREQNLCTRSPLRAL